MRWLLSDENLRELIGGQSRLHLLTVKDDEGWFTKRFPEGVDELYIRLPGVIKDLEQLHGMFNLFARTLQLLCHLGSAYEDDPGIVL